MAIAYITGGATGIGAAAVRKFAAGGAAVAVFDINRDAVEALAAEGHDGAIRFYETDVRDRQAVRPSPRAGTEERAPVWETLWAALTFAVPVR